MALYTYRTRQQQQHVYMYIFIYVYLCMCKHIHAYLCTVAGIEYAETHPKGPSQLPVSLRTRGPNVCLQPHQGVLKPQCLICVHL